MNRETLIAEKRSLVGQRNSANGNRQKVDLLNFQIEQIDIKLKDYPYIPVWFRRKIGNPDKSKQNNPF